MLVKLAFRNVRRSSRDYAIYFITVALGVAMFYAFNAIEGQAVLFDALSADSKRMIGLLNMMVDLFSGVVACVLGFLVVYANRFLIRRRRREFGTYLMLGMSAGRVSRVLLCETAIVGLASLIVGLALGIAVSQGLSFATAALMGTTMTKYRFIVSGSAVALTALCFVVIFAVSAVVDVLYVRRCKLVNLLSAHDANEGGNVVNMPLRIVGFVGAVALLACAYWQLSINGMQQADAHFWAATALMVAGTVLFFWSVAGFAIFAFTHAKGVYLKGLRMFTVRQLASKINTAFASMSVVCVMLFLALTTASVGLGLIEVFSGDIEQNTRYDATLLSRASYFTDDESWVEEYERYDGSIAACLSSRSPKWDDLVRASAQVDCWEAQATYRELLDQAAGVDGMLDADMFERVSTSPIQLISEGQYNATCSLIGEAGVDLAADEFAIDNTLAMTDDLAKAISASSVRLSLSGVELHGAGVSQHAPLQTTALSSDGLMVIVPDDVIAAISENTMPYTSYLNIMYNADREHGDEALEQMLAEALPPASQDAFEGDSIDDRFEQVAWPVSNAYTGRAMADQAGGLKMVIAFLALYIGLVMLVATAAILAIQQLSETADSLPRYRRLSNLGCGIREIMGSLRTQTIVYFCAPLVLAAAHTACAVSVVTGTLFYEMGVNMLGSVGFAAGCVAAIYGVYLVVTYALSRSIVRAAV